MLGQTQNLFHVAPKKIFERGLTPLGDGQFVGKLAYSRQNGISDKNMFFIGQVKTDKKVTEESVPQQEFLEHRTQPWRYSYKAYIDGDKVERYNEYKTKIQFTAYLYSLVDRAFKPDPKSYIRFTQVMNAFLFSIMLSLIVLWVYRFSGMLTSIIVLGLVLFSPMITLMSQTLYFALYTWFLPFLGASLILQNEYSGKSKLKFRHYLLLSFLMFYHILSHCFEFIPCMGIMAVIPFILYGLMSGEYFKWFKRLSFATIAYIVGMVLGIFILFTQIGRHEGSLSNAFEYVTKRYAVRTGDLDGHKKKINVKPKLQAAFDATYGEILQLHYDKEAISFYVGQYKVFITFKRVILFTVLLNLIAIILAFKFNLMKAKTLALSAATWFSVLAPLSWFIPFKPHSYLHHHFTPMVWYTPFIILCGVIIGHSIQMMINIYRSKKINEADSPSV